MIRNLYKGDIFVDRHNNEKMIFILDVNERQIIYKFKIIGIKMWINKCIFIDFLNRYKYKKKNSKKSLINYL